ncbi:MAG: chromosomal replication initiator protein DnaA, partial [Spirochaetaceae bacterium]|nr:chromosomal replication initiator protein DnaA [Spirochaetaceae bacterium]
NKKETQDELFNTFNTLHNGKKQMIFTCDRPHTALKMSERLVSRLGQGLRVDIGIPGYETRYAILLKKIEASGIEVPSDIIELICRNISTNIRDMVSAFINLKGYVELLNKPLTLEIARQQLKDALSDKKHSNISIDTIISVVASQYGISITEIKSKKKSKNIVFSRQVAMYISRTMTELSLTDIAGNFGGRDHSTAIHAIRVIENQKNSNPNMESELQNLMRKISEQSVK